MRAASPRNRAKRCGLIACLAAVIAGATSAPLVRAEGSPAPAGEPVPWDFSSPVRPFAETCLEDFFTAGRSLPANEARRWLAEVPGKPLEIGEQGSDPAARAAMLKGLARLKAPWPGDAALRLTFASPSPVKLHLWSGREGVLLVCYRVSDRPFWAAYRTTRHPLEQVVIEGQTHQVIDPGLALLATDDLRAGRSLDGTVELRHQQGTLVVTKGEVRLITVPLEGPPKEVFIDAPGLMLRDVAMVRGEPAPDEPPCQRRVVVRGDRPAALPWTQDTSDGGELRRLDDGRVALRAGNETGTGDAPIRAWMPLPRPGLYEVEMEVEDAEPGTGVYLGDSEGRPVQGVEFLREPRSGRVVLGYGSPGAAPALPQNLDIQAGPVPFAGPRQWLRLVMVAGTLKCWTSGDGAHWGQAMAPLAQPGAPGSIGLFLRPGDPRRAIGVRTLRVRELDALAGLARPETLEAAIGRGLADTTEEGADPGAWQQRVFETLPPAVDPAEWRAASALAALMGGADPRLGKLLLAELVSEGLRRPAPPAARLRLLEDAAAAMDAWQGDEGARFGVLYERFCRGMVHEPDAPGPGEVRRALAAAPVWASVVRIEPLTPRAAADHLAALAAADRWPEVFQLCRQARFWNLGPEPWAAWPSGREPLRDLVGWLGSQASGSVPKSIRGQLPKDFTAWGHPVVIAPDKDTYNTWAEIRSAVANGLFADAARMLGSARVGVEGAMVADPDDPRRFRSMPAAVEELVRQCPPLAQAMQAAVAGAERLRIRQLLAEADVAAVEALAVRHLGTAAAAEANVWLGDRHLAAGDAHRALGHYRKAAAFADPGQKPQLAARFRLAAALQGRDAGPPAKENVRLGQVEWNAAEFEQIVAELRGRRAAAAGASAANGGEAASASLAPGPQILQTKPWATVPASYGVNPQEVPERSKPLDWPARQTAVTLAAGKMIVANRFQAAAWNLADGAAAWSYAHDRPSHAHGWPLVPMRPLVAGGRVFVRMLPLDSKPQVVCLDLATGKPQWQSSGTGPILCDPLLALDRLFVLAGEVQEEQPTGPLWLVELNPATGAVVHRHPLTELRYEWLQHRCGQATVVEGRIVAALGGAVLCCDPDEGLIWARRGAWIPPTCDPDAARQVHQPPLAAGDRVWTAQPGVRTVECLELASGRLVWRRYVPGLEQLACLAGDRLIAATDDQLLALAASTGEVLWRTDAPDRLEAIAPGAGGTLLFMRRQALGPSDQCPVFAWCDVQTGREVACWPLIGARGKRPMFGPLVTAGGRTWVLTAPSDDQGAAKPPQSIVELLPGGPLPADPGPRPWNAWVEPRLRTAVAAALPGWTILSGACDERTGLVAPVPGIPEALVTKAAETPARLGRRVVLAPGRRASLALELGHDAAGASRVDVRVDGLTVAQTAVKAGPPAQPWTAWSVDLTPLAGRTVWIAVVQEQASASPAYAWWKRLEVIDHGP